MVTCPKCIVQCGVPSCLDVIQQSEMVVPNRDNARKHLDIDEQTKAWSLKEVKILLLTIATVYQKIESKSVVVLTWLVPNNWKWPIASPLIQAFHRKWRLVMTRGKLWFQYYRGVKIIRIHSGFCKPLDLSFISSRFFIEKTGDDAKKVIISRGHIKLKVRRGHSFALPSKFAEGTVNCRIVELAAILENKS
ncbi:hypothetical protein pdam_00022208 [Pocillopora damicornis]|uniref:Uncharacterized protein n=1 Tax=Pocillopora damicornis TaxID=46731 RepID=A0A3M6ULH5_POCDA|nr:hypothetical protein pdam_00022208 [Pocillopora damicornis]